MSKNVEQLAINTIRLLSVDAVSAANSGHPGAPLGLAPASYLVWKNMKFNHQDPKWINRDRFVLSNGHGCAMLYSLLLLYDYGINLTDLKNFRQCHSKTPGHPERSETTNIDVTTGPLGQGISNAVGLAIAQSQFSSFFNKPEFPISDSYTYVFLGDGCLMEGISSEACSLAGHLKLGKLIAIWDNNKITIDGKTEIAFTEDVSKRFSAYGWHVIEVEKGDSDLESIQNAIEEAKSVSDKPSFIKLTTMIGFGSLNQGSHAVHGSPLKPNDVEQLKSKWGFDSKKSFVIPHSVDQLFKQYNVEKRNEYDRWCEMLKNYKKKYPELGQELDRRLNQSLPKSWESFLPVYTPKDPAIATRKNSEIVLNKIFDVIPELIGGSADLTPSNLTKASNVIDFQHPSTGLGDFSGRYIRFGVREHAMGAIMNGISAFGANFKSFGGTFLNFVSYASGAIRLAALSHHPVIWIATHDSIGLGEDGPTHQPVETLAHLRAIPNLSVWRPADGNETSAAYYSALNSKTTPTVISLTRQNLIQLNGSSLKNALNGGYTLIKKENPDIIIISTGSEVSISCEASKILEGMSINASVVSLPDFFTFDRQPMSYKLSVLPDNVPIISFEVLSTFGWSKYSHQQFGLNQFGISGKYNEIYEYFDFTPNGLAKRAIKTINFYKNQILKSPLTLAFE